jgi:hypothetical protein
MRPVAALEIDGVLVLEDPVVPVTQVTVHACVRPEQPWPFLPVQFRKLPAIRTYAAGRAWVLIDDSIHDFGLVGDQPDGLLVPVDPGRGITAIDPDMLRAELDRHVLACADVTTFARDSDRLAAQFIPPGE